MRPVKDFDVGLGEVKDALLPAGEQRVTLRDKVTDHGLIDAHYMWIMFVFDQAKQARLEDLGQTAEDFWRFLTNRSWKSVQCFILTRVDALVSDAGALHVPALWIAAVTAPAHIRFQPRSVPFMIRVVEAIETDDARWVLLAILALPGHISVLQHLSADAKGEMIVPDLRDDAIRVLAAEQDFFRTLEITLHILCRFCGSLAAIRLLLLLLD